MLIRPIQDEDWPSIVKLETEAYGPLGLSEDPDALRSRAAGAPEANLVMVADDAVIGYLLALPYPPGRYPDLTRPEPPVRQATNLHVHDLVVASGFRSRSLAERLLDRVTAVARAQGFTRLSGVAVNGAHTRWTRSGFQTCPDVPIPDHYGPGAVYITRPLATEGAR
ncbi:GNAT family N-acetyltransferase [Kitasatospora acidiphila]|uniref:GNAT family N-acetyltransferase n=1 Tax=Kitasatospora acidiphila TaxID=2567942 RepID=UPI001E504AFC|nr:GNAT family N-acetyltransferase [Kitasatospora acidiphila]